jgi:hypothetical protein
LILCSVVYRDVTRQAKGLYRLKHVGGLGIGLAYLSRYNSGWFCHRLHPTKAVHWYLLHVWMTPAMRHLRLLYFLLTLWRMILWSPHPPEWLLLMIFLLRLLFIITTPVFRTISGTPKFVPTVLLHILQSPCKLNQCLMQLAPSDARRIPSSHSEQDMASRSTT